MFGLFNRAMQRSSNLLFRNVLSTQPMDASPGSPVVLYTALNGISCRAYLLAAKSLLRYCPNLDVVVQNDGSLTDTQVAELKHHIRGCTVYSRQDMDELIRSTVPPATLAAFPPLERCHALIRLKLLNVLCRFGPHRRVIVLDSDIVCLRRPEFVIDWVNGDPPYDFYGGGGSLLAEPFRKIGFDFRNIDIGDFNSGLMGLRCDFSFDVLADIARRIGAADESLFRNWEIEQAIWAVLLNERRGGVNVDSLQSPYIGGGWRRYHELRDKAIFAHFVGAIRFKNLRYLRVARDIVRHLNAPLSTSPVSTQISST
jgi:hypothetical protein